MAAPAGFSNINETPDSIPAGGGALMPFAGVMVSDPAPFPDDTATITLLGADGQPSDAGGTFPVGTVPLTEPQAEALILQANSGTELPVEISPGVYKFLYGMTPANLSEDLGSLVLTAPVNTGASPITTTVALSVSNPATGLTGLAPPVTVTQDGSNPAPRPARNFLVSDVTTGGYYQAAGQPYSSTEPVAGLTSAFVTNTSDILNITAEVPNVFIEIAAIPGQQAPPAEASISVADVNGNNLLDGGANSNFLVGGTGTDTFYIDDRTITANAWSTIVNFHAGDVATLWGITQADFTLDWIGDTYGAGGANDGLTGVLTPTTPNRPEFGITLAGRTMADLSSGALTIDFGTVNGNDYMSIRAH